MNDTLLANYIMGQESKKGTIDPSKIRYIKRSSCSPQMIKQIKKITRKVMPKICTAVYQDLLKCNYNVFVYCENILVGFICCVKSKKLNKTHGFDYDMIEATGDTHKAIIELLCLTPALQGLGVGKKIVTDFLKASGDLIVYVGTSKWFNFKFYEALGFHRFVHYKEGGMTYVWCKDKKKLNKLRKIKYDKDGNPVE